MHEYPMEEERMRLLEVMDRIDGLEPHCVAEMELIEDADGRPMVHFIGTPIRLYLDEAWQFWLALSTTDLRLHCASLI